MFDDQNKITSYKINTEIDKEFDNYKFKVFCIRCNDFIAWSKINPENNTNLNELVCNLCFIKDE